MAGEKITQQEMFEMFGEEMPAEAFTLLFDAGNDGKTIGEIRDELRAIAKRKKDASTDHANLVERLRKGPVAYTLPSGAVYSGPDALHREAATLIETITRERDEARAANMTLLIEVGNHARARGKAEGALNASELAGVVDGWKSRAEAAEREVERRGEALDAIFRLVTYPVDTSISPLGYGLRSIDISGCEYIAEKVMSVPEAGE